MGASASRPEEEEEEPLPEPEWSRVTVNPKLLQQLAGENSSGQASGHGSEDDSREAPHHFAPGQGSFLHQPSQRTRVEEEAAALAGDLNRSRRVGGLLLRHEDDELAQVQQYAEELLDHEYRAPSRKPPCVADRDACLACYTSHPKDPLACASSVSAYKACAQSAFAQVTKA
mmetsp:Transcript_924/g.2820  ORF Transcript_924/g.2820 Transcript_924/m.2820 type:complete len:172 (+) Transcript_924:160-675(+)